MRQLNTYHSEMAGYLMDFRLDGFIGYGKGVLVGFDGKRSEQKVDVMHDGVVLAASLKDASADSPVVSAVKEWEAYANDDAIYNDGKFYKLNN